MVKDGDEREKTGRQLLARRLAEEADISEQQANDLIKLIGTDWSWLLREARFLKERN
ncbi:hypothetical protein GCM10007881_34750 [Mesorhizobium huakuii]|uniref:hypothetical protein n=1 Tax=Mesorhizobium TaxID=68287 RepID=UPI001F0A5A32|nr:MULTISPECIES: hypothetical protein [Mesorhizobium]MCH4561164.1 hypothetical protein [Mesorhizobium jarvisii]GLQ79956.1 hypothetical protein GCM10007881_34750 [Mesorhizobium huakuii]